MIYLGADHRGFELKEKIKEWLSEWKEEFEDLGNEVYDKSDDYPVYASRVAEAVGLDSKAKGIVICGSGIGVSIVVNRYKGARGALGFDRRQVRHGVESDNINVLSLASDYTGFFKARKLIKSFLSASFKQDSEDIRRIKKIEEVL